MMHRVIEHYMQRDILRTLSRSPALTFGQLKPDGVGNNAFSYHLNRLLHDGLITKTGSTYTLSPDGARYASWASRTNLDIYPQPKIFCLLLIENDLGEFVMYRRSAEPFLGRYTFPGGALFFGESLDTLTKRQMQEKIGLDVPLTHRGIASVRLGTDNEVLSHSYAHLLHGDVAGKPTPTAKDSRFTPEWIVPSQLSDSQLLPDILTILDKLANTPDHFYFEFDSI